MTTTEVTIPVTAIESSAPRRARARRMIPVGAAALVAVVALSAAVVERSSDESERPAVRTVPMTRDERIRDLVDKGLIPRQSLEPAPMTRQERLQDLVDKGLIPRQSLEPAPMTRQERLQDLVDKGLIPRQSLEPAPMPEL